MCYLQILNLERDRNRATEKFRDTVIGITKLLRGQVILLVHDTVGNCVKSWAHKFRANQLLPSTLKEDEKCVMYLLEKGSYAGQSNSFYPTKSAVTGLAVGRKAVCNGHKNNMNVCVIFEKTCTSARSHGIVCCYRIVHMGKSCWIATMRRELRAARKAGHGLTGT